MKISSNSTNFTGIRLKNSLYEHAKYVDKVLTNSGVYVSEHKTFKIADTFESKKKTADYLRKENDFIANECGIMYLPWSKEIWIIGKPSFEQKIKRILDSYLIDSEINLGVKEHAV